MIRQVLLKHYQPFRKAFKPCLGPLHYVSHIGGRPMSVYWDLEHPMPAWFFEICASLRAA